LLIFTSALTDEEKKAIEAAGRTLSEKKAPMLWAGFTKNYANSKINMRLGLFTVADILNNAQNKRNLGRKFINGVDWDYIDNFYSNFVYTKANKIRPIHIVVGPAIRVEEPQSILCKTEFPKVIDLIRKSNSKGIQIRLYCLANGEFFSVDKNPDSVFNCHSLLKICLEGNTNFKNVYDEVQPKIKEVNNLYQRDQAILEFDNILNNYQPNVIKIVDNNQNQRKLRKIK